MLTPPAWVPCFNTSLSFACCLEKLKWRLQPGNAVEPLHFWSFCMKLFSLFKQIPFFLSQPWYFKHDHLGFKWGNSFLGAESFIFGWISVRQQISTQARKAKRSERELLIWKACPLSPALLVCVRKVLLPATKPWPPLKCYGGVQNVAVWIPCQEVLMDSFWRAGMPAINMSYAEVSWTWMGADLCFALQTLKAIPWPCYRSNIYARMKHSIVKALGQIESFVFPCYYLQ